jgi:hypothetical protein
MVSFGHGAQQVGFILTLVDIPVEADFGLQLERCFE